MAINSRIEVEKLNQWHINSIFECYGMTGLPILEDLEEISNINVEQIKRGFERQGYFIAIPEPIKTETNFLIFSPVIDTDHGLTSIYLGLTINEYKGTKGHLHRIFYQEIKRHLFH